MRESPRTRASRGPSRQTFRQRLRSSPGVGKALRYAKRTVVAPRNAQLTLDQTVHLEQVLRECADQIRAESYHDEIARYRDFARQDKVLAELKNAVMTMRERM